MLTGNNKKSPKTTKAPGYGATWGTRLLLAATLVGGLTLTQLAPSGEEQRVAGNSAAAARVSVPEPARGAARRAPHAQKGESIWARFTSILPSKLQPAQSAAPAGTLAVGTTTQSAQQVEQVSQESGAKAPEKQADPILAKLSPDLQNVDPNSTQDVIVQFRGSAEGAVSAVKAEGATEKARLSLIQSVRFQMRGAALKNVAAHAGVAYITPNRRLRATNMDFAAPAEAVMATAAWTSGWTGNGIGVAVIDSGIKSHTDLNNSSTGSSRVVYSEAFKANSTSAGDQYGHGTHVAGIVGGNGKVSESLTYTKNYRGVAPKANLLNLAVLDENGSGRDSDVIAAIDRAVQLKAQYNIRVMNLSLGRPIFESYTNDPLCLAVQRAWEAGIVVVVAAGNNGRQDSVGNRGYGTITSPGNSPFVITVGAMRTRKTDTRVDDQIASYSSKGPTRLDLVVKPDLVAPGDAVVSLAASGSTLYNSRPSRRIGNSYFEMSGTSMAAPMVSGAVALMLEKDSSLTPDQVKARLMRTAYKTLPSSSNFTDRLTGRLFDNVYDIFTVGAGYMDVQAALSSTALATKPATSPKAEFNSATGIGRLVHALGVVWGEGVLWGSGVVWGEGVIWGDYLQMDTEGREVSGSAVIWGAGVVWGDAMSSACGVIWGQGVLWGESTTDGDALSTELTDDGHQPDPVLPEEPTGPTE